MPILSSMTRRPNELGWHGATPHSRQAKREQHPRDPTVGLMKLSSDAIAPEMAIDEALIADILHCRGIKDHRGRRRMERHITNQLRLADEQTLWPLRRRSISCASCSTSARRASYQVQLLLTDPAALQEFVERSSIEDHANIQRLRQLTRNARRVCQRPHSAGRCFM